MQAEIGLAIILIIVLLADLFQKVPSPKNMQRLSCALLVILLLNNLFNSASGEAFGSMYINTPMTSVVKSSPHIRNNTGIHAGRHMAGTRRHTS